MVCAKSLPVQKLILLVLLLLGSRLAALAQESPDYIGWYVGADILKLVQTAGINLDRSDVKIVDELYTFEAISYYQISSVWRPTIRAGFSRIDNFRGGSLRPNKRIFNRGVYAKAGADIIMSRNSNANHAIGLNAVYTSIREDYTFKAGNRFFGYEDIHYAQETDGMALELNYAYALLFAKRFNLRLATFFSYYDWEWEKLKRYEYLPGITRSIGFNAQLLYKIH